MKKISNIAFIIISMISSLTAMEEGLEKIDCQSRAVQSKRNYLKLQGQTYITFLPEHITTALQNKDEIIKTFVLTINNQLKKKI